MEDMFSGMKDFAEALFEKSAETQEAIDEDQAELDQAMKDLEETRLKLDDRQKEGLALIRSMLGSTSSAVAIPQLESMMEKTDTNEALLLKMKDWFALMNR